MNPLLMSLPHGVPCQLQVSAHPLPGVLQPLLKRHSILGLYCGQPFIWGSLKGEVNRKPYLTLKHKARGRVLCGLMLRCPIRHQHVSQPLISVLLSLFTVPRQLSHQCGAIPLDHSITQRMKGHGAGLVHPKEGTLETWDSNSCPWSECSFPGTSKRVNTCVTRNSATVSASWLGNAKASGHSVK